MTPHFNILYPTLCKSVSTKWEDFGIYLGVDPYAQERIKRENEKDLHAAFRETLKEWLKQINPRPTKSKIIEVLRELSFHAEADKLEKKL